MLELADFALIGLGKMGSAILTPAVKKGFKVLAFDIDEKLRNNWHKENNVQVFDSIDSFLEQEIPLLIAVKPNTVKSVVRILKDERLIISIAAGIETQTILDYGAKGHIIRVMPNTPFLVGEGISCYYAAESATDVEIHLVESILQVGSEVIRIDDENKMHAVTALSGSGPAFFYMAVQAAEDAGVALGLSREVARKLATQTMLGASVMVKESKRSPQELIHDVTSPGGTTIAGIEALKSAGFESAMHRAIDSACKRSKVLAKS